MKYSIPKAEIEAARAKQEAVEAPKPTVKKKPTKKPVKKKK